MAITDQGSDKKYLGVSQFRQMLGILGKFSMSIRIFKAIDSKGKGKIYLQDYLIYNDIVSYGT
jgi:hypothetical protein